MIGQGTNLESERLILRPPVAADLDGFAALMADERSARFIGGVQPRSAAWRQLCTIAGSWYLYGWGMFSVIEKSSGRWIGRLGPMAPEGWPGTEVGYALLRDATGKGYATEGAAAAIDWAFEQLGWTEVIHCIHPDNHASQMVAKRLGSRLQRPGQLPAPFKDMPIVIWNQTRTKWRARRARARDHESTQDGVLT